MRVPINFHTSRLLTIRHSDTWWTVDLKKTAVVAKMSTKNINILEILKIQTDFTHANFV